MELDLLYCVLADSVIFGSILGKLAGVRYIVGGFRGLGMTWSRGQIWGVRITRFLCNSYIVNSDAVKEARITREHLSADNIKVIPNGLDLSLYPFTPKKEALVGMVASLKKIKGQDQFIEAARILIDRGLELKFMLVGDGPDRQRLEEKVQRLNLQDAFVFKGNVSNVANYITRFKILVSASEFEGLSNSILEALSAGTPVIASDVPSNNEIISNMEDGLLYEYGNAEDLAGKIVLMIENSAMYGSMQIKARQKAERDFEMSKMITRMEDYFQSLMLRGRI
jgi:glycosyltransferase involved in cell wall biosynthesis